MLLFRVTRWMHLVAAATVAVWPATAVNACCCTSGEAPAAGDCWQRGCCAADNSACHTAEKPVDSGFHCCPSAAERESCRCWHDCTAGAVRRDVCPPSQQPWRILGAAPLADTWRDLRLELAQSPSVVGRATSIPARPARILYCVWRN
jgi:hypothetical protein